MFGTVLGQATGVLDKRFVLGLLFPCLAFAGGVLAFVATVVGWAASIGWWEGMDASRRWLLVAAAVAALVFVATLVGTQVHGLIRLLEGYWGRGRVGRSLAEIGRGRQRRRLASLVAGGTDTYVRLYFEFGPTDADVMPTRLGNVLKAAEAYPGDTARYGVDAVFFWPRLYLILPAGLQGTVDEARSSLDQTVVLCWLSASFSLVAFGFAWWLPLAVWLPAACGSLLLARACYLGAVSAAAVYGDLVRSTYDLYRRTLLQTLGFDPPTSLADERALWLAVKQQLLQRLTSHPELLVLSGANGAAKETTPV